jgi:hypothetical protein
VICFRRELLKISKKSMKFGGKTGCGISAAFEFKNFADVFGEKSGG